MCCLVLRLQVVTDWLSDVYRVFKLVNNLVKYSVMGTINSAWKKGVQAWGGGGLLTIWVDQSESKIINHLGWLFPNVFQNKQTRAELKGLFALA